MFCGIGYFLLSQLNSAWQLYVFYGLVVGIGLSSADVIALTVTARWFVRRRGMVTGTRQGGHRERAADHAFIGRASGS